MSDRTNGADTPDFDAWEDPEQLFEGPSIKERMVDVIIQLREPTKVSSIAERVGCDVETARDYLEWFTDLGLVRKQSGPPARYERNESFLRWRRIEQLRTQYSEKEIVDQLREMVDDIQEYQARFGVETPGEISFKKASKQSTVEDVWEALSTWQTLENRTDLLNATRLTARPSSRVNINLTRARRPTSPPTRESDL